MHETNQLTDQPTFSTGQRPTGFVRSVRSSCRRTHTRSPRTSTSSVVCGRDAGPEATEPSASENALPCQPHVPLNADVWNRYLRSPKFDVTVAEFVDLTVALLNDSQSR